jgi:erythromycin esterase-like protein
MSTATHSQILSTIRRAAHPITDSASSFDPLLDRIGDASIVLLGEASHGTHEFYSARAVITRRLIEERGFNAVAVEADWPDAHRVNRYVRGADDPDPDADAALAGFRRFPTWMWRNRDVLDFVAWLRRHNSARPRARRAGFYGLDLYSLFGSIQSVLEYLDRVDPEAAERARFYYGCFDHVRQDSQEYGYQASLDISRSCQDEVVAQLADLRRKAVEYAGRDGLAAEDEYFDAEQNARLVRDAERYYRAMFAGRDRSWNLRDTHMADTLDELIAHLERHGVQAKVVVWEHNSHLGDARATEMGAGGELNVGQLVRERHGPDAVLIGFTTHEGTVTAADGWGKPAFRKHVRPSLPGSVERLFHESDLGRFCLIFDEDDDLAESLRADLLERAIGVIYRPRTERISHYFRARVSEQFDAVLHYDTTHAVEPLERSRRWERGEEAPETYPSGF